MRTNPSLKQLLQHTNASYNNLQANPAYPFMSTAVSILRRSTHAIRTPNTRRRTNRVHGTGSREVAASVATHHRLTSLVRRALDAHSAATRHRVQAARAPAAARIGRREPR